MMKKINSLKLILCSLVFAQEAQKEEIPFPPENKNVEPYLDFKNRIHPSLKKPDLYIEKRGVIPPQFSKKRFK